MFPSSANQIGACFFLLFKSQIIGKADGKPPENALKTVPRKPCAHAFMHIYIVQSVLLGLFPPFKSQCEVGKHGEERLQSNRTS